VTVEEYAMGERGQSPLLYLGSPYLDFLDMDVSVDGTHGTQLTSQEITDSPYVDSCLSVQNKQTRIYLNGQLVENGLVVTTNSSATAEQSEILE
jgi:fructose-1,6-bisphosphatase/sedoheptulose 1,7-bisphosphatase-like protein